MCKRLVIIGASGHGKVVADIAEKNGYEDIAFLDDNTAIKICGKYKVIGRCESASLYKDADFVVAIGNAETRRKVQIQLSENRLNIVSLLHPDAVVAEDVAIGKGTVVMAGAVINPGVRIGKGCIINTCSSVDHDCEVGDYVHIAVGSHLCGTVFVRSGTWIGAGATVSNNISICPDCMIGAGAVVVNDIQESGTYVGVPARRIDMEEKSVKKCGGGYPAG